MLKIKYVFLSLLGTYFLQNAYADCGMPPDQGKFVTVIIDNVYSPVYDGSNVEIKGCIVGSEEKVLGFSEDREICELKPKQEITVRLYHACCDSGPDFGDWPCIVRTKKNSDNSLVRGNGMRVVAKDKSFPYLQ